IDDVFLRNVWTRAERHDVPVDDVAEEHHPWQKTQPKKDIVEIIHARVCGLRLCCSAARKRSFLAAGAAVELNPRLLPRLRAAVISLSLGGTAQTFDGPCSGVQRNGTCSPEHDT